MKLSDWRFLAAYALLAIAIGMAEVEFDGGFAASPSVIEVFRLVEAPALKRALARAPKEGRTIGWVSVPGGEPAAGWRAAVRGNPLIRRLSALEPGCHLR